ncbi:hypothetical protein [Arcanobacterium bovis]|uniref:Shikimate kinase n=1 Tax=Arcanobacterium bovis TaxID=2529275 RepID=A0A4Q9V1J0_9ACTO|nr:hypothetical protein [Arcanobacterium bovis]TBW22913.1 hypothetical protein EZJ44_03180 [Arcanobacterium bovis]
MTVVFLIGAPGTGKSAAVRELDKRGWIVADIDSIVHSTGRTPEQYILDDDLASLRGIYRDIFMQLVRDIERFPTADYALALPSQLICDDDGTSIDPVVSRTLEQLRAAEYTQGNVYVVGLIANISKLMLRNGLMGNRGVNPVLPRKTLRELNSRFEVMMQVLTADIIDTSDIAIADVVADIERICGRLLEK